MTQADTLKADYLVMGTGATAMAFVDTLLSESPSAPNRLRPASKGRFKRFWRCVEPLFSRYLAVFGVQSGRKKGA
jgi:hypothetical protein